MTTKTIVTPSTDDDARPARDSVAAALEVIGDRWVFLILREAFFGVKRYDELRKNLGASPNILADRLKRLVDANVLEKTRYSDHKNRFEYQLTEKGLDLYPMIVMLLAWGDKWEAGAAGPPLSLIHEPCGHILTPTVNCSACGEPVRAQDVSWRANTE
ncbi:MAG: helix-turn-helix domain-containing protein [Pseudomonadota bacterium]